MHFHPHPSVFRGKFDAIVEQAAIIEAVDAQFPKRTAGLQRLYLLTNIFGRHSGRDLSGNFLAARCGPIATRATGAPPVSLPAGHSRWAVSYQHSFCLNNKREGELSLVG